MNRTENNSITVKLDYTEIKAAIVKYVKEKNPDLKDLKPTISIDIDFNESLKVEYAELKFIKN